VGKASLVMKKDGTITINGQNIDLVADKHMGLDSKRIDIN
jgi:type VI secretion system secreted protein VgrG